MMVWAYPARLEVDLPGVYQSAVYGESALEAGELVEAFRLAVSGSEGWRQEWYEIEDCQRPYVRSGFL